jgi:hypothetical protein
MPSELEMLGYEAFLIGEAYCNSGHFLDQKFSGKGNSDFKYVIAANLALGLELYLKCLLMLDGQEPKRDHDLEGHFGRLPIVDKDAIRLAHKEYLSSDPDGIATCEQARSDGANPDEVYEFDSSLKKSALAFVRCRYPFDPGYKTPLSYLAVPIEQATRVVIVRRNPGWEHAFWGLKNRSEMLPRPPVR